MPFEVDGATLHTAANDVRTTRDDVQGDLKLLWNAVDDLAIAWKGQASVGFQNLMTRWNENTEKLMGAMGNIAELLDTAATRHQVTDEEQQELLNKFHTAINP